MINFIRRLIDIKLREFSYFDQIHILIKKFAINTGENASYFLATAVRYSREIYIYHYCFWEMH